MNEPFKLCPQCGEQNKLSAQFCQRCGATYKGAPPPTAPPKKKITMPPVILGGIAFLIFVGLISWCAAPKPNLTDRSTSPATAYSTPAPMTPSASGERQVLDDQQVTIFVECTNREYRQYKVRFVVKKPGSPLIAPVLRQAGNPAARSVVVNGVDTDDDFAFSPNMAVFDKNLEPVQANYKSRPLNGDDALSRAYHDLVMKYERSK